MCISPSCIPPPSGIIPNIFRAPSILSTPWSFNSALAAPFFTWASARDGQDVYPQSPGVHFLVVRVETFIP